MDPFKRIYTSYKRDSNLPVVGRYAPMVQKIMKRISRAGDTSALRKQILVDILGKHVEEYENFNRESADKKRHHRTRIPLWKFLLHLLHRDTENLLIEWNKDKVLEFRIKDPGAMAILWGSVKNKTDMTYEKFGRAMRYYYGKNIIEKVSGRRYSYRFVLSKRTRRYMTSHFSFELPDVDESDDVVLDSEDEDEDSEDDVMKPPTFPPEKRVVNASTTMVRNMNTQAGVCDMGSRLFVVKKSEASCSTDIRDIPPSRSVVSFPSPTRSDIHFHKTSSILLPRSPEREQPLLGNKRKNSEQIIPRTVTRIFRPEELLTKRVNFRIDEAFATSASKKVKFSNDSEAGRRLTAFSVPKKMPKLVSQVQSPPPLPTLIRMPTKPRPAVFSAFSRRDLHESAFDRSRTKLLTEKEERHCSCCPSHKAQSAGSLSDDTSDCGDSVISHEGSSPSVVSPTLVSYADFCRSSNSDISSPSARQIDFDDVSYRYEQRIKNHGIDLTKVRLNMDRLSDPFMGTTSMYSTSVLDSDLYPRFDSDEFLRDATARI